MTDWHSHLLPAVDDGSRSVEESLSLLSMLRDQGVTDVAATPHFDPTCDEPSSFLLRRDAAHALLLGQMSDDSLPAISLGAEVAYFSGISNMAELESLAIGDTGLLLLEMPMERWGRYTVEEVLRIIRSGRVRPVLAHIERYLCFGNSASIATLCDAGAYLQSNASFFIGMRTRRRALMMLKKRQIRFLGSDCHSVEARPPRIAEAMDIIVKKLGNNFELYKMQQFSASRRTP